METRFIRWTLLLLLLAIIAAEGLQTALDEGKPSLARVRGSSRFSSRKSGTSESSSSEATPANSDSKATTKATRFSTTRKVPSKRFGGHTTVASAASGSVIGSSTAAVNKSSTEHNLPKSRIEAALQRRAEKLKTNPQKPHPHGLVRIPIRKIGQKGQTPEPEKSTTSSSSIESTEEETEDDDKKYLSDSEDEKSAKEDEDVDGIEAPKGSEVSRVGGRGTTRVAERSKLRSDYNGPALTTSVDSRLRTGRKIQSQTVLSPKQLKSNVPSSSRFSKVKTNDDSEVEEVTDAVEAGSIRRSFEVEAPNTRKNTVSYQKHDIATSASENIRVNIPLKFEDSKKLSGSSHTDDLINEPLKRPINLRYKGRSRQTFDDAKLEVETSSTESISTRSLSRRFKGSTTAVIHESSTNSVTARSRGRPYESRKSTVSDISTSTTPKTSKTDLRRRNFYQKPTTKGLDTSKAYDNNKVSESKSHNIESKKPSRPRGRYKVAVPSTASITTTKGLPSSSSTYFSSTFLNPTISTNMGIITPSYQPETIVTTSPIPISLATTTPRASVPSFVTTVPSNTEINRNDEDDEEQENTGLRRRASKEDFFNHGLGFRGRRPAIPGVSEVPAVITTSTTNTLDPQTTSRPETPRGNPGWTLRRRPGHWHDGTPSGPFANLSESPIFDDQDRQITTTIAVPTTTPKAGRRGNKTFSKGAGGGSKIDESSDNENYPPDFKARIAQLQKTGGPPRTQTEEPQLQTSSNVTGSASADLELAPSDNEYLMVTQTADPISTTTLSLQIPSLLEEQQAIKTPPEIFAARSKMKLDDARKLVKPELNIDETNARQVIVDPFAWYIKSEDQNVDDSEVDEDQKVIKVARKPSASAETSQSSQKNKSDWKPSKLRKDLKDSQIRTPRYKLVQQHTTKPKVTYSKTDGNGDNSVEQTTKSALMARYQEHKYKYVPKQRDRKLRGPKPSDLGTGIESYEPIPTTKPPSSEKPLKMFMVRKNEKDHVEDVKAVALKLRKSLESMDKNHTSRPPRRSDFSEGSTTLLTTMRTVKSFSFSTRLVKMDESEATLSSSLVTTKMLEDDELRPTGVPISTSLVTEIVTFNPGENSVTTSGYESALISSDRPNDLANEIEPLVKSGTNSLLGNEAEKTDWKASAGVVEYREPHAVELTNDTGSPVFVVYPSATEKPLSIAITPKISRYHTTAKQPVDTAVQQPAIQEAMVSVKVSSSSSSSGASNTLADMQGPLIGSAGDSKNIFNPAESSAILETGNVTILEQLRSTVAPLLGSLGAKSPVFAGIYKNTNSANSLPRVTPSGAPPKFSARYKGAELFVRRPTPATIMLSENIDSALKIDVSSPGEPKVLTFHRAVKSTSGINNEQTDVRSLWQPDNITHIENNTTRYETSDINSFDIDSLSLTPKINMNTTNNIGPLPSENLPNFSPDTTESFKTSTSFKTTQQLEQISENFKPESTTSTLAIDRANEFQKSLKHINSYPTIIDILNATEDTTENSMSTSTELITEVSVLFGDILSQTNAFNRMTTPIPLEFAPSDTTTAGDSNTLPTIDYDTQGNSQKVPSIQPSQIYNAVTSTNTPDVPIANTVTERANLRSAKKLDDSISKEPEVSSSLLGITLFSNQNESPRPTILEIKIEQEPMENTKLEILSNVKTPEITEVTKNLSSTQNRIIELSLLSTIDDSTNKRPQVVEQMTTSPKSSSLTDSFVDFSLTTELSDTTFNSFTEIPNLTEMIPNINSFSLTTNLLRQENKEATTIQLSDITKSINNAILSVPDTRVNTSGTAIQFYNATNTTVPAGTKILTTFKDSLYDENEQFVFKKLPDSELSKQYSLNNFLNNTFKTELMKIVETLSVSSPNTSQLLLNLDKNNMNNSPDGLLQLLGGFLDNTNKSQSVTNDGIVENNSETLVVTQTKIIPTTTLPEQITSSVNTDIYTKTNSLNLITDTQANAEALETTTLSQITINQTLNGSINNVTNTANVYLPTLTRMIEIVTKLLDINSLQEISIDSLTQKVNSLTSNATESSLMIENLTRTLLIDDSINLETTIKSIQNQTTPDLSTIIPTLFTHFQGSSRATAQRTAGITKRPNQSFTTSNPKLNYPSSFAFSLNTINTNKLSTKNLLPYASAKTTNNVESVPSKFLSTTKDSSKNQQLANSLGTFGTFMSTPAPMMSSSTSTAAPLRDYVIYGVYPNKTIVRKRPEDNIIDPRNVDSPYVIFGIFPDGRLIRKFPNGTIIPDPPSSPVEVVFSLSTTTTTTNKPRLIVNQASNQNLRNQNIGFSNIRNPIADVNAQKEFFAPNEVDNALSYSGPTGFDLPIASFVGNNKATVSTKENSQVLLQSPINLDIFPNSQTGSQVTAPPGFPWQDPLNQVFGIPTDSPVSSGSVASNTIDDNNSKNAAISARPPSKSIEIFSPVSSTINSLINNPTKATTKTVSISTTRIIPTTQISTTTTSTTTTTTQAPITTSSTTLLPITLSSNAFGTTFDDLAFLNALLEKPSQNEGTPKTLSEAEQLLANKILSLALGRSFRDGSPTRSPKAIQLSNASPNSIGYNKDSISTLAPSFTGSSSQPIVIDLQTSTTRRPSSTSTTPFTWKPIRTFVNFGDDLQTSPSTLTSTASPTTLKPTTTSTTTTTTLRPTTSSTTTTTTLRPTRTSTTTTATPKTTTTTKGTSPTTTQKTTTTKGPVIITAKPVTTKRPRPVTQAPPLGPFAFAANILQNIFGQNLFNPFAQSTTSRPFVRRPSSTSRQTVFTTPRTTSTTPPTTTRVTTSTTTTRAPFVVLAQTSYTPRSIQIANSAVEVTNGQVAASSNIVSNSGRPVEVTPRSAGAKQLTTYSPEEDAKFLTALLNAARTSRTLGGKDGGTSKPKPVLSTDDEAFLRSVFNSQSKIKPLSTVGGNDENDAALLAAYLKSQGVEPSTPGSLKDMFQNTNYGEKTSVTTTTKRPTTITTARSTTRTQRRRPSSSTYPTPLFRFGAFGSSAGNGMGDDESDEGFGHTVRNQVVNAAIGMTRAFGQFLGAAIAGASQQIQFFVRNGTRWG